MNIAQLKHRSFRERVNKLAGDFDNHITRMTNALDKFLEVSDHLFLRFRSNAHLFYEDWCPYHPPLSGAFCNWTASIICSGVYSIH
jgi:hypothetical protein